MGSEVLPHPKRLHRPSQKVHPMTTQYASSLYNTSVEAATASIEDYLYACGNNTSVEAAREAAEIGLEADAKTIRAAFGEWTLPWDDETVSAAWARAMSDLT